MKVAGLSVAARCEIFNANFATQQIGEVDGCIFVDNG